MLVEKKEGATMICTQCGAKLICGMSKYPHPYKNKLQWQNSDGSAHYKYDSGKFSCTGKEKESKDLKRAMREQDELMREAEISSGEQ